MKKFNTVLLIGILLIIAYENIKSQEPYVCPPGYTQLTANIPVIQNGDTCIYEVILCVKCRLGTSPSSIVEEIMVHAIRPLDTLCQCNPDSIMNTVIKNINDEDWIFANIIPYCSGGWPPCNSIPPNFPIQIDYYYPICWKWDYFEINENPPDTVQVKVAGCDCYCKWSKFFCWNGNELINIPELDILPDIDPESTCNCLELEYEGECWQETSPCSK